MNYHDSLFRLFFVTPLLVGSDCWIQNSKDLGMLAIEIRLIMKLYTQIQAQGLYCGFQANLLTLAPEYKEPGLLDN